MGLDSVDLIVQIEKAFDIQIPDSEAEKISTVGHLYACVERHYVALTKDSGPDRLDIQTVINHILTERFGIEPQEIAPNKSLTNDLGID